jgi:hypothetical protein
MDFPRDYFVQKRLPARFHQSLNVLKADTECLNVGIASALRTGNSSVGLEDSQASESG